MPIRYHCRCLLGPFPSCLLMGIIPAWPTVWGTQHPLGSLPPRLRRKPYPRSISLISDPTLDPLSNVASSCSRPYQLTQGIISFQDISLEYFKKPVWINWSNISSRCSTVWFIYVYPKYFLPYSGGEMQWFGSVDYSRMLTLHCWLKNHCYWCSEIGHIFPTDAPCMTDGM